MKSCRKGGIPGILTIHRMKRSGFFAWIKTNKVKLLCDIVHEFTSFGEKTSISNKGGESGFVRNFSMKVAT